MLIRCPVLSLAGAGNTLLSCSQDFSALGSEHPEEREGDLEVGSEEYHNTVLLKEAVHFIAPSPGKVVVDGTLGGGGHSEELLKSGCEVYGIDRDPEAHAFASKRLQCFAQRFHPVIGNFADIATLMPQQGVSAVDGILVDIGVSSRQFDAAERGFSFSKEGSLDMRMGPSCLHTAGEIINTWTEDALTNLFWKYGEEKAARRIAKHICLERVTRPFQTTTQLAHSIEVLMPRRGGKIHPATRVFQALRIEVNDELGALKNLLETAGGLLRSGGRLVIISFHSLEDRMVKRYFRKASQKQIDRPEWPEPRANPDYNFRLLTRKPVRACSQEIRTNRRSRSAVLRAVEKI